MRACGCGLRRTLPQIMPGMVVSAANWARPVTLSMPSGRMVRWPIAFVGNEVHWVVSRLLLGAHFGGGVHHRADDLVVSSAPAEVAGEPGADFLLARIRVLLQQRIGSDQHAGSADAALQRRHFKEFLLQRMQLSPFARPSMVRSRGLPLRPRASPRQIRLSSSVIEQAPQSPEAQPSLEPVRFKVPRKASSMVSIRLAEGFPRLAVDRGGDVNFGHEAHFPGARLAAMAAVRLSSTPATFVR